MAHDVSNACVFIKTLVMGPIENNVYIVSDGVSTFVVDPTGYADRIVRSLPDGSLDAIVLTHAHWDHVGGAKELRNLTGAPTIASAIDAPYISGKKSLDPSHRSFTPCPIDHEATDGEKLQIGSMTWEVLLTPGHTPGGMCLYLDPRYGADPEGAPVLISGDTLFCGTHGRTDFVGGDPAAMSASLKRLALLPEETIVLPGHNALTTIGAEKGWLKRGGIGR